MDLREHALEHKDQIREMKDRIGQALKEYALSITEIPDHISSEHMLSSIVSCASLMSSLISVLAMPTEFKTEKQVRPVADKVRVLAFSQIMADTQATLEASRAAAKLAASIKEIEKKKAEAN